MADVVHQDRDRLIALNAAVSYAEAKLDEACGRWQRAARQPRPMQSVLWELFILAEGRLQTAIARREKCRAELEGRRYLELVDVAMKARVKP